MNFSEKDYPYQDESYEIIGLCMGVHRVLGQGLLEIVYKDALEYELKSRKIKFERERNKTAFKPINNRLKFLTYMQVKNDYQNIFLHLIVL